MTDLIPEKRVDRNGKLVTKHVKASSVTVNSAALPAPALPTTAPVLHKDRVKQHEWRMDMYRKYPDPKLQSVVSQFGVAYGNITFQCSDIEAYDVLRASHGTNAFLLLNVGIRSKEEAVRFYTENDLAYLIEDNDEWVDQAIARNLPAPSTLDMAGAYGSHAYREKPGFMDALEANGVRVLRDIDQGYYSIPSLIMRGEISYDDVKVIGASRLAKASRKTAIITQLRYINAGKSKTLLDIDGLKKLIQKYEYEGYPKHRFADPLTMAADYGADTMLKLRNFERAANFLANFRIREYAEYNRAEIITFQDDLYFWCAGRHSLTDSDIFLLAETGITARDIAKELDKGHTILQIAAMAQNVQSSISSGWL